MKTLPLTFFVLLAYSLPAQINLEEGLVAYYPFAGDFIDNSSFGNDAAIVSGAAFTYGYDYLDDEAVIFDGVNDYVEIPHANQINFPNQTAFSISLWVRIPTEQESTEGTVADIVSKWNNSSNEPYPFTIRVFNQNSEDNGKIHAVIYQTLNSGCSNNFTSFVKSETAINDTKWHHILVSRTENNLFRLYIDCQLEDEVVADASCVVTNNSKLLLGRRASSGTFQRPFTGAIDEFRMYNRVLSPEEMGLLCITPISSTGRAAAKRARVVYPNPLKTGQSISIKAEDDEIVESYKVYGNHGAYLGEYAISQELNIPAGFYYLLFTFADATQFVGKLMVVD